MSPLDDDPFTDPSADLTIWSSDGVAFKLHKVVLTFASDYFRDLLSSPQWSLSAILKTGADDNITLVKDSEHSGSLGFHFPESSDVLGGLFRLIYPIDDPPLEDIGEIRSILQAAKKYHLREAAKIAERKLLSFVATDSLRVYAIACQLRLEDTAKEAAQQVLKRQEQYTYAAELEDLPASSYRRLLTFCEGGRHPPRAFLPARPMSMPPPTPMSSALKMSRTKSVYTYPLRPASVSYSPKIASRPFNARDADIILSASDGMQFRVYKNIIELASPVIAAKLASPPNAAERCFSPTGSLRRLSLPESSQTLAVLLKICYPTDEKLPNDIHTLHLALLSAKEYQMDKAIRVLEEALMARRDDTSVAPELLYAIACRCNMKALAAVAAKRTLRSGTKFTDAMFNTFERYNLSAGSVQRLLSYQKRCRAAARYVVGQQWRTQLESSCRLGKWASDGQAPCWYERYMSGIAEEGWPTTATATNPELLRAAISSCKSATHKAEDKCRYCSDPAHLLVYYEFTRYVAETIEALESKVVLEWPSETA